jgi:hypothetical protein
MNHNFLAERMKVISEYQRSKISTKKDGDYYIAYINKLTSKLVVQACTIDEDILAHLLDYITNFERFEYPKIRNGIFHKPKDAFRLACQDARDVVNSMRRWEGVQDVYDVYKIYGLKD